MDATAGIGLVGLMMLIFISIIFLVAIAGTVLWIWMLIDCLQNERSQGNEKLVWALVIILTHSIGALLYFLVRRPRRMQELGV